MSRYLMCDDDPATSAATEEASKAFRELPQLVRQLYCLCYRDHTGDMTYGAEHMPAWDGGTDAFGKRTKPVWPKIADKILALGADPISFIKAQFGNLPGRRPPHPNQLLGETAVATWKTFAYTSTSDLARRRERENLAVRRAIYPLIDGAKLEFRDAMAHVLMEPFASVAASPLFRYCVAAANQLNEVASYFFARAVLQYALQKGDYDQAWSDLITAELRTTAETLRSQGLNSAR